MTDHPSASKQDLVQKLTELFADTFSLYLICRNFHWNIACPRYQTLHCFFEEQYHEQSDILEEIAIRIRALGGLVPCSYMSLKKLTKISEISDRTEADYLVGHAQAGHVQAMQTAQFCLKIACTIRDVTTQDLMSELISMHEKSASILKTFMQPVVSHHN